MLDDTADHHPSLKRWVFRIDPAVASRIEDLARELSVSVSALGCASLELLARDHRLRPPVVEGDVQRGGLLFLHLGLHK